MRTVNGKLIIQEIHDPDSIETQLMNFSQQQSQESNNIQNQISQLDKKCILLEEAIARQFTQFLIINICSIIGLFFLFFLFNSNHQTENQSTEQPIHLNVQQTYQHTNS